MDYYDTRRYRLKRKFLYPIRWKYQRLQFWWWRKHDPVSYDATDLFSAQIDWLLPRLRYMREHGHGYPFEPELDDSGDMIYEDGDYKNAMTFDRWNIILDEMIEGFALADENDGWSDNAENKEQKAADLLGKWFYALWM